MPRADPAKGEATLGDKLLRMNFRAWRAFEHASGKKLPHLMLDFGAGLGCDELVEWVGAFLVDEADVEQVLDLIEKAGHPAALKVLSELVKAYFGDLAEDAEKNPPLAA